MNNQIDATCAEQSAGKRDSLPMKRQAEFCGYKLRGGSYKEYQDKGYGENNMDRLWF